VQSRDQAVTLRWLAANHLEVGHHVDSTPIRAEPRFGTVTVSFTAVSAAQPGVAADAPQAARR
jgi:hypothetical protein